MTQKENQLSSCPPHLGLSSLIKGLKHTENICSEALEVLSTLTIITAVS